MQKKYFYIIAVLLLIALVGCGNGSNANSASNEDSYMIKIGHGNPPGEPTYETFEKFVKKELEEKSEGRIKVEIFPQNQLGTESELLDQVKSGTLQVAAASAPSTVVPEFSVFYLPYLFKDQAALWEVSDGPIGQGLNEKLEEKTNGKVLGWWSTGIRHIFTKDKEIRNVDDLHGLKIRVMEYPVLMDVFKGLGASPTPLPYADVYGSLATNVIDGADNDPSGYKNMKFYEVANNYSLTSTLNYPKLVVMNEDFYNSLPEELQKVVDEVFSEAQQVERDMFMEVMESDLQELKDNGVNIIEDVDIESFTKKAETVWESAEGVDKDLLNEILESRK